jgi:selenocysteine lyase/cysteine desulfurase
MNRKTFLRRSFAGATAFSLSPLVGCASTDSRPAADSLDWLDVSRWSRIRKLFPLTRDRVYFNTGGLGPPSRLVLDTLCEQTQLQAERGETYHGLFEQVRDTTARFFGADASEIAFNRNATEGNSIIAAGLDLRAGDEVIFESHAHPGGSIPWMVQQKEKGIRVRIFEPDSQLPENNLDRIFSLVNERTRVIQVSHLTAPTGILFDVQAIAREARARGIWFHIDGAQSAGMIPFDLHEIGCDSYATSGHKWLNGPQGSGILYIARERIDEVACSHAGAYSDNGYELPDTFSYNPTVQRHEYGTRDAATILGIETALRLQERIGRGRIAEHGKALVDQCREALSEIPGLEILTPVHPDMYHSMITFRLEGKIAGDITSALTNEHNLRCREVNERNLNAVRISWHVYNDTADIPKLTEAVRKIAAS